MPNYEKISSKIEKVIINNPATANEIVWLNIINAGKPEIELLRKQYGFNIQHLRASTAKVYSQRPMLMDEENYLFLILHFPSIAEGKIIAQEIEFFVGHGYLITLHNNNLPPLTDFFGTAKKAPDSLDCYQNDSSAILLAELLDRLIKSCYPIIDQNSLAIDNAETIIFQQQQDKAVSLILRLRHNIINIRKIIQNHKNIFKLLVDIKSSIVPAAEIKVHYLELIDDSKRIWEMLENQKEMVEALNSTNESLMNARMANVMKTLTIISVIVIPLTFIAAVFSMRAAGMPIIDSPYSFWIILLIMAAITTGMLAYFRNKHWLN
ncbi:MAG: magnesium transporter CorA family protein [Candidatus Falkowbacteria bacterium]